MSIFSSISSAVKSAATGVYKGLNYAGSTIKNVLSGGGTGQTTAVYNATPTNYTPSGQNYTAAPPALNYTPSNYTPAGGYAAGSYSAPKPTTVSAGGSGSRSTSSGTSAPTSYNYSVPTTITRSTLSASGTPSINLPAAPVATTLAASPGSSFDLSTTLTPGMVADGYTLDDKGKIVAPGQQAENGSKLDKTIAKIKELMPEPPKTQDIYANLEKQSGLEEKKNLVNNLTSQLNTIKAQKDANLLQLRGTGSQEGVTEAVYGGQQAQLEREATIKSLPLAAQLASAKADYQAAQEHVDKYFSIISSDLQAQYKYKTDLIKSGMEIADKEEARQLAEMKDRKDKEFTTQQNNLNYAQTLASAAIAGGQGNIASALMRLDQTSPSYQQDIARLAGQITGAGNKDQGTINTINSQLTGAKGEDGFTDPNLYARLRASSGISPTEFDNRFGYLVNPASYAKLGLSGTKEVSLTGEQLKQKILAQTATAEFKALSKSDKKDYILSQGGDPADFDY
jgi:hypothetical protein